MKKDILKALFIMIICIFLSMGSMHILNCSFDYDNNYALPKSLIGQPCEEDGVRFREEIDDWYYCAMCCESADGLTWFEISCEDMDNE